MLQRMCSLILLLCLTVPVMGNSQSIYQSDFENSLSNWRIMESDSSLTKVILNKNSKEPDAHSLQVDFPEKSTALIGLMLNTKANRRIRIDMKVKTKFDQTQGKCYLAMKCYTAQGDSFLWVNPPWMGENYFKDQDEYEHVYSLLELPEDTGKILLFIKGTDYKGSVWIKDVNITPFKTPTGLDKLFPTSGEKKWGATGWFVKHVVTLKKVVQWIDDKTIRDTCCKLLVASGLTISRTMHFWDWLEPTPNNYDFSRLDDEISDLKYYGAEPILIVHGVPEWAHKKTPEDLPKSKRNDAIALKQPFFPPENWGDYERFIKKLAQHFKGRIRYWECMNEVDTELSGFNYGYKDYQDFLKIFYETLKSVDSENIVLCTRVGGSWLPLLLENGIADYCDAFTTHPYHSEPLGSIARAKKCQLFMAEAKINKPLYITEIGFSSGDWKKGPGHREGERRKAEAGRIAVTEAMKMTDMIIWYDAFFPNKRHGLLRNDTDRVTPVAMYYEMGDATGKLKKNGGPVKIEVKLPAEQIQKNQVSEITLKATNTTNKSIDMKFWPVGLVKNLGFSIEQIRKYDWQGKLKPGQSYEKKITVKPNDQASGQYKIGLAVITDQGNSLWLEDLSIAK